jgi:hypothetical protein
MRLSPLLGVALGLAGASAHAADGAVEINQARVIAGGITATDTPGFPVEIDAPGHFRLTGDLTLPDEQASGIWVTARDVSIDLGGFRIVGPNTCPSPALGCTLSGNGIGIEALPDVTGLHVENGSVRGMGGAGIFGSQNARIERVRAFDNGGTGTVAGPSSHVLDCLAERNGAGITIDSGRVERSVARANVDRGIAVLDQAQVIGNAATGNGGVGIYSEFASLIVANTASENGSHGIRSPGLVHANVATGNGGCGIVGANNGLLQGNATHGNATAGLHLASGDLSYLGNVVSDSTPITTDTTGIDLGHNHCAGPCTPVPDTTCNP